MKDANHHADCPCSRCNSFEGRLIACIEKNVAAIDRATAEIARLRPKPDRELWLALYGQPVVPVITAENAREHFGAGSDLGDGLTEALSPGGVVLHNPQPPALLVVEPRAESAQPMPGPSKAPHEAHADCKACQVRKRAGFEGQCPPCAHERTRTDLRAERLRSEAAPSKAKADEDRCPQTLYPRVRCPCVFCTARRSEAAPANATPAVIASAYCAWLNEAARLRNLMIEKGQQPPFTLENVWACELRSEGPRKTAPSIAVPEPDAPPILDYVAGPNARDAKGSK